MPVDLRCKHDREVRARAADLFAAGRGSKSVARAPHPRGGRAKMAPDAQGGREGDPAGHGEVAREIRLGDIYSGLDLGTRKVLLGSFRIFFRHTPVRYHTFAYATKQFAPLERLAGTMRRDLVNFLFDNLAELQGYDAVKVYYDNGQRSIAVSLHLAVEYALSRDTVVYRSAQPCEYRLSQVASYICTMELTAIKFAEHATTATDEKFFGKWSDFKKGILKETRKKLV